MRIPLLAAIPSCVLSFASLDAQDTTRTSRDSVARRLEPVTVTGTRAPAAPLDVPLAITVVERAQYSGARGTGIDEALATVPGVLAQSRSGNTDVRIVIRGFGARGAGDRSNAGTTRGIRVLTDGFPETEPDGRTALDLIDLGATERIEVVRSNASAAWGNAAGGVIHLSTVPSFDNTLTSAQGTLGAFGLQRYVARAGTRTGSGRLYATYSNTTFDGWRAHSDSRRSLLNAGLVSPLGTSTTLGVHLAATDNAYRVPGPLTQAQVDADPRQANATYLDRDERRHNRLARLGLSLEHDAGRAHAIEGSLFVTPKYLQRSERGTFRDFTRHHLGGNILYRNTAWLAPNIRSTLAAGVDEAYQDGAILFYSLSPTRTRGDTLRSDKREGANNLGFLIEETVDFGGKWIVSAGARLDAITYYYDDHLQPALNDSKTFRGLTPKLGITWRPSPTRSVYASLGGGVEAPAGNETDPAGTYGQDTVTAINPLLDPIRSTTYEVGTKGLALGRDAGVVRAVRYDVALYWTTVRNEIVPYRGGRFYFTAGKARRAGAELGLRVDAAHGLSLEGALTYSDNRYSTYVVDSAHYGVPGRTADYSGHRVVGVPDVFYGATLGYAPPLLGGIRLRLGAQGTGRYFADDANTIRVPAYLMLNASVGLDRPRVIAGGLALDGSVSVNNLTNRRYMASAFLNPDIVAGAPVAFEPGLPRGLVVSVSVVRSK